MVLIKDPSENQIAVNNNNSTEQNSENSNTENQNSNEASDQDVKSFNYKFVSNYNPNTQSTFTPDTFDGKIYKVDKATKKETLVMKSIKAAYPPINTSPNYSLEVIYAPENSDYLYFTRIAHKTDGGQAGLIRYDGKTNKLTELKISEYYFSGAAFASKTSPYAASISSAREDESGKTLHLLDFEKDTVKTLAKIPANQTFNLCSIEGCMGGTWAMVNWLSANQFEINIYDAKGIPDGNGYGGMKAKLLEKKKFQVNS